MSDVQERLARYLDAKQHLWNTYFLDLFDGLDKIEPLESFETINSRLFYAQLTIPLGLSLPTNHFLGSKPIDEIEVKLNPQLGTVRALLGSQPFPQRSGTAFRWIDFLNHEHLRMSFVDFFQWNRYGYLSTSRVRCRVIDYPFDKSFQSSDVILEFSDLEFAVKR